MSESSVGLFPVLPLRDIVVFPHMIVPLFVGREKSVRALEDVMKDDKQILLVTQKNAAQDDPSTRTLTVLSGSRRSSRTIPRPTTSTRSAPSAPCCSSSGCPTTRSRSWSRA
jgi:ATP-dependent Lon protease